MKNILTFIVMMGICLNVVASNAKKGVVVPNTYAPHGTYSEAIQFGDTVYIAGQIALDPKTGKLIKGNFKDELRQVLTNVASVAKASGGSVDDILKVTVYLKDLNNFNDVNKIMKEYFRPPYPARQVIEIKGLPEHAVVEVEAVMGRRST